MRNNLPLIWLRQTAQPYTTHVIQHTTVCHAGQQPRHDCHAGQPQQPGLARRLPDTEGAKVLPTSDQVGFHLTSTHQMALRHTSDWTGLLLIYRPRKDERLSWPSWLTCNGRFTHIVVTCRLQAERRTGSVRRPKTGVLPTVLRSVISGLRRTAGTDKHDRSTETALRRRSFAGWSWFEQELAVSPSTLTGDDDDLKQSVQRQQSSELGAVPCYLL